MKKRLLAMFAVAALLFAQGALAEKVSYIEETGDVEYHIAHLKQHGKGAVCTNTGELVIVRPLPASDKVLGRMKPGEQYTILDSYKEWLRIQQISSTPDNPESKKGMIGWVTVEYADCGCDREAYYAPAQPEDEGEKTP